jgi:ribosomal protein S27AE
MVDLNEMAACGKCGNIFVPRFAQQNDGKRPCPACGFIGIHFYLAKKTEED